jgi:hypothetical protein
MHRARLKLKIKWRMSLNMLECMHQSQRIFAAAQPDKDSITLSNETKFGIGFTGNFEDFFT